EAGTHDLITGNLPILSTLKGWKYGFNSPFKAEVYFVNTRPVIDLKWGTPNPIILRDPEFGPIRVRAFGTYVLKAVDPKALLTEIVGTGAVVSTDEVTELVRAIIIESLSDMLGTSEIAALDFASNYRRLASELQKKVQERIDDEYGLELPQLMIVNISLPDEVEKALDLSTKMKVIGDMNRFQQYQIGEAMTTAAANPAGGGAAEGLGLGIGLAMANRMAPMGGIPMGGIPMGGMPMTGAVAPAPAVSLPPSLWHVAHQGQTLGPFSGQQMIEAIGRAELRADTMVWTAGMPAWQMARDVPQLAGYFQAPPPPPPVVPPPPPVT
ncbi:MAG: SPFH domain-containing protein, partial [Planctomycetota bacterium]